MEGKIRELDGKLENGWGNKKMELPKGLASEAIGKHRKSVGSGRLPEGKIRKMEWTIRKGEGQ